MLVTSQSPNNNHKPVCGKTILADWMVLEVRKPGLISNRREENDRIRPSGVKRGDLRGARRNKQPEQSHHGWLLD